MLENLIFIKIVSIQHLQQAQLQNFPSPYLSPCLKTCDILPILELKLQFSLYFSLLKIAIIITYFYYKNWNIVLNRLIEGYYSILLVSYWFFNKSNFFLLHILKKQKNCTNLSPFSLFFILKRAIFYQVIKLIQKLLQGKQWRWVFVLWNLANNYHWFTIYYLNKMVLIY